MLSGVQLIVAYHLLLKFSLSKNGMNVFIDILPRRLKQLSYLDL